MNVAHSDDVNLTSHTATTSGIAPIRPGDTETLIWKTKQIDNAGFTSQMVMVPKLGENKLFVRGALG